MKLVSHPPERRRRGTILLQGGCCTCCCCCCVHAAGGVLGSIYGSMRRGAPPPESETKQDEAKRKAVKVTVKAYWLSFTIVTTIALFLATIGQRKEEMSTGPIIIAFCLPLCQLAASLATWAYLMTATRPRECYRRLGRITLFGFLGALAGSLGTWLTLGSIR